MDVGNGPITHFFRQADIHDQHVDLFTLQGREEVCEIIPGFEPASLFGDPECKLCDNAPLPSAINTVPHFSGVVQTLNSILCQRAGSPGALCQA